MQCPLATETHPPLERWPGPEPECWLAPGWRGLALSPARLKRPPQGLRWERTELHWLRRLLKALRSRGGSRGLAKLVRLRLEAKKLMPAGHWALKGEVPRAGQPWMLPSRKVSAPTLR